MDVAVKKNMPYKFTHLLYWSKLYLHEDKYTHIDVEDSWFDEVNHANVMYCWRTISETDYYLGETLFLQNCIDHFSYPLKYSDTVMIDEDSSKPGALPIRRLYVLEFSKINAFIDHLKELVME